MNDPQSVAHFHEGGASNPGMQGVYDFGARAVDVLLPSGGRLLDLGVGSGRALSAILRRRPDVSVTGVDLAPNMLATAKQLFVDQGVGDRVELVEADITALPEQLLDIGWDAVSCMWTMHQLPELDTLHAALRQIAAIRERNGSAVWISDFQRLCDPSAADAMLRCVDPLSPEILRNGAIASEAAAFTIAEMLTELSAAELGAIKTGHATPLPYLQAHWLTGAHDSTRRSRSVRNPDMPMRARREAAMLRWGFTSKPF